MQYAWTTQQHITHKDHEKEREREGGKTRGRGGPGGGVYASPSSLLFEISEGLLVFTKTTRVYKVRKKKEKGRRSVLVIGL